MVFSYPYLSKVDGIGGQRGQCAEDFVVEEIGLDGTVYEIDKPIEKQDVTGDFCILVLQKRNWTSTQAIRTLSKALGVGKKRASTAGNKDRCAVTTQLVSLYKIAKERLTFIKIKDLKILGTWYDTTPVSMGDLLGNRFKIRIENIEANNPEEHVGEIYEDLEGFVPNYFGPQRFGMRGNTHIVGKNIVKGNFRSAVMEYLTGSSEEEKEEVKTIRTKLGDDQDFSAALRDFPRHLKYERTLLGHLVGYPNDYIGALRRMPRTLTLMFVHAYQSYLFNEALSQVVNNGVRPSCKEIGNVTGYETTPNEQERVLLEKEGINVIDFKISACPELSSKGVTRPLFVSLKDFAFTDKIMEFELPSGAYATCALREFLDRKKGWEKTI